MSLVISGSVLFATAWLPTAITGSFAGSPLAIIPVFGPLAVAGQSSVTQENGGSVAAGWLVFDGLQQAAGLAMFIAGFAAKETVLLRSDVKDARAWWLPVPMTFGPQSGGFGFRGAM
jgi:hypothetical protein